MTPSRPPLRLLALLALGALALAAAVGMARAWLPEWRSGPLPEKRFFVERYRELAREAGARLEPGEPRLELKVHDKAAARSGGASTGSPRAADAVSDWAAAWWSRCGSGPRWPRGSGRS